jgi:hypothetical protein
MIKVFDGEWRGLGENSKQKGAIISFEFRNYLHHFKGASLHVFMSICLHVDRDGYCYPSYDTIQKETGYGRGTVAKAIAELCDMEIEGHKVLMKWRERDDDGKFTGSNRYRIFPTADELEELNSQSSVFSTVDSQSSENPTLEKSNSGKSELEDKPVSKDKPVDKEPSSSDENKLSEGESKSPDETQQKWFEALFWLVYDHDQYNTVADGKKKGIAKAAKELRINYSLDDLRGWYRDIWTKEWPGKQKDGTTQRPKLADIKEGIGRVRAKNKPKMFANGTNKSGVFNMLVN